MSKNGYSIYGIGFAAHAHSTGALTLEVDGHDPVVIGPDNVETLREVLRLAAGMHSQARRRASRDAYEERYPS